MGTGFTPVADVVVSIRSHPCDSPVATGHDIGCLDDLVNCRRKNSAFTKRGRLKCVDGNVPQRLLDRQPEVDIETGLEATAETLPREG